MCLIARVSGAQMSCATAQTVRAGANGFPAPPGSTSPLAKDAMESRPSGALVAHTEEAVPAGANGSPRHHGSTSPDVQAASKLLR